MKSLKYLFLLYLIVGCSHISGNRVRIVDNQGRPAKINKIVPEFNEEQLEKQKEAFNKETTEINKFRNDFNSNQINNINDINDINNNQDLNNSNLSIFQTGDLPDNIFADRIVNYNYLENDSNIQVAQKNTPTEQKFREVNVNRDIENTNINTSSNTKTTPSGQPITNKVVQGEIIENNSNSNSKKITIIGNDTPPVNSNTKPITTKPVSTKPVSTKPITTKPVSTKPAQTKVDISKKGFYIQIGIYSDKKNAEKAYQRFSKIHSGGIDEYISRSKRMYKVLLGSYSNKKQAEIDLEKVIKTGHYDVYITEKK